MDAPALLFPARFIEPLELFISVEETRYYLNGIHFRQQPDKDTERGCSVIAETTDGHRALMLKASNASCTKNVIVRFPDHFARLVAQTAKELCVPKENLWVHCPDLTLKPGKSRFPAEIIHIDPKAPEDLSRVMAITMVTVVDGTFPDIPRLVPTMAMAVKNVTGQSDAFQGRYLADFAKAAAMLSGDRGAGITVRHGEEMAGPNLVILGKGAGDGWEGFGILMPTRDPIHGVYEVPSWARNSGHNAARTLKKKPEPKVKLIEPTPEPAPPPPAAPPAQPEPIAAELPEPANEPAEESLAERAMAARQRLERLPKAA